MKSKGRARFTAYSAGSHPSGMVRPEALRQLESAHIPTDGFRSKSWEEFTGPDAPALDFVFTVCDSAAKEVCPVWPGQPITAHWSFPDPAAFVGPEAEKHAFFAEVFRQIENQIKVFAALPLEKLDRLAIQRKVREIGASESAQQPA